jgi:HD-like signal output (HDOD) protein
MLKQIAEQIASSNPNLTLIGQLIKKDVTLFGAILRLVNSPAFGFKDVKTIDRAIMLLGIQRIGKMVQVITLQQTLSAKLKMNRFWDTATEVADITSVLAGQLTGLSPDDAYAAGMFHDFGIPLMMQAFDDFKELMAEANRDSSLSLAARETERYGFTHYEVGYELGRQWLLPNVINMAIRYQPQFDNVIDDRIAIDDIETVKALMALLEMAKNISATYRKYWRSQDQHDGIDINPLAYEFFDLSADEFAELRENYVHDMSMGA